MDDKRIPKEIFFGDVGTGSRRHGGQGRRYKHTLKTSLKRMQINPAKWEDLARDRPTWGKALIIGAAIYEADRITAAKAKREAFKSQLPLLLPPPPPPHNASSQPPRMCPWCQWTFRAPTGFFGHLWTNCSTRTAPTVVSPSTSPRLPHQQKSTPLAEGRSPIDLTELVRFALPYGLVGWGPG
nr:unnamed protein product [Spirometra erinaceieuropaei]